MGFTLDDHSTETIDYSHVKRVAILGAGVAGLQTAAELKKVGITDITIFEKADDVGGVWRENYADFGLQVPRSLYEFPGFPWPEDLRSELFPKGPAVAEYIKRFARARDLVRLIKFETHVVCVHPIGDNGRRGWRVYFAPSHAVARGGAAGATTRSDEFDYVVVSTGMYSAAPHLPLSGTGAEDFGGEIVHSSAFVDASACAGKRVVVVGGGKSAVDCAVAASKAGAAATTLLYRHAHWPVPRYLANVVPFAYGTYSRFGHATLPAHYDHGAVGAWLHAVCAPLKWLWWRVVELLFRVQFGLRGELVPETPLELDVFTGGQILTYELRDRLRRGAVAAAKGAIARYTPRGVRLASGDELEADVVVYGTGFAKDYGVLDARSRAALPLARDGLYLYRNMLAPRVPDLAFVGAEVSTFNNILTHGLQARWLARVLAGELALPSASRMEAAIEREQAWKRTWMPRSSARASILQLHMPKYHDALCKDMGEPHLRKSNPLAELFMPYTAADYAGLFK